MKAKYQIPKRITVKYLRSIHSCRRGIATFRRLFGESAAVTTRNAKRILAVSLRDEPSAGKAFVDYFLYHASHDLYAAYNEEYSRRRTRFNLDDYYRIVEREFLKLAAATERRKGK